MPQSEQHNTGIEPARLSRMFGSVRAMYVIGTAQELLDLRARNERRLQAAKAKPAGQQVYRDE